MLHPPLGSSPLHIQCCSRSTMVAITIKLVLEGVAALVALLLLYKLRPSKSPKASTSKPPEPGGRWPIIGHLRLLSTDAPLHRTLAALSDQYGPIFMLRMGQRPAVVVSSMEIVKECFTTNDRAFASRPPVLNAKYAGYNYAMLPLAPYGSYWRKVRKISTLELFSNRRLELLKYVRLEEVNSLVKSLYRDCGKEEPVDMKRQLGFLAMNVVLRMVAGKRYFTEDGAKEDEEATEWIELVEELSHAFGTITAGDLVPWLEWLDVGGHLRNMKRVQKRMDKLASSWVAEHRQDDASGSHDFIGVLTSQLEDGHLSDVHQPNVIIKATTMAMILAGTSTTSDTLVWALCHLLNNCHELKKAQEELDIHVGRERQVDESDISKLTYLQAIVKETMRLCPSGPLLIPHMSIEPVKVAGYHIPAGTSLYVNAWKMHRDPRVWSDPEEFKPGRFLTNHREVNVSGQNFELIPFGSGRRSCPGTTLALQVTHLTLACLLHGFEWCTPMDGPVDMTEEAGLGLTKATPLHVLLRPRLPSHLYEG